MTAHIYIIKENHAIMNSKFIAFVAIALMVVSAASVAVYSDDSDAAETTPITGQFVNDDDENPLQIFSKMFSTKYAALAKFTLNSKIDQTGNVVINVKANADIEGTAYGLVYTVDKNGKENPVTITKFPENVKDLGDNVFSTSVKTVSKVATVDFGIDSSVINNYMNGAEKCVFYAVFAYDYEGPLEASMTFMVGDKIISNTLTLVENAITGESIKISELPSELGKIAESKNNAFAGRFDLNKKLDVNDLRTVCAEVKVSNDVTADIYAVAVDKDGNTVKYDGINAVYSLENKKLSGTTELGADAKISVSQLADKVGGSLYVLVIFDKKVDNFSATGTFMADDHTPISQEFKFAIGGTQKDAKINGNDVKVTENNVIAGTNSMNLGDVTITIDNDGNIASITYVEGDAVLNDAMKDKVDTIIAGAISDKKMIFDFGIIYADGATSTKSVMTMAIDISQFELKDGQKLAIKCIGSDGKVINNAATITNDGIITFNHNSTYMVYVVEDVKESSTTALALGAVIAVICIIAAVLSVYVTARKN